MLKGGVAKRYAKALFEVAVEKELLDRVASDMILVANTVSESDDLRKTLLNPTIPTTLKEEIVRDVFTKQVTEVVSNFLRVLVQGRREAYMIVIANEFQRLYDQAKGRVKVLVESAVELSDAELSGIKAQLSGGNKEVEITTKVTPSLIGGVRVTVGDKVIDASVKTQLDNFRSGFAASGLR
jgi:F-type H+-transporting ATPase subunit delta